MRNLHLILFSLLVLSSNAQNLSVDSNQLHLLDSVELRKHIEVLASDSLEGRYTGSEGQKKAAYYISSQFQKAGLIPYNDTTFFQTFYLWSWQWGNCTLAYGDKTLSTEQDFIYRSNSPSDSLVTQCVFVGFGEDTIIDNLDLKNKIAFAFTKNYNNYYHLVYRLKSKGTKAVILTNPDNKEAFSRAFSRSSNQKNHISKDKPFFSKRGSKVFIVQPEMAKDLFGRNLNKLSKITTAEEAKKIPEVTISANCPMIVEKVYTENVAGYIKGKSNETIVLSAHYDHIGKRGNAINYGADDNASGTSALIALAKTIGQNKEPLDKNILFLATTGEELGLLGALHFADHQDDLPFDIKANLNIDMIGRTDSSHKSNYIYLIGAREYPLMDSLCQVANQLDSLTLDYSYTGNRGFGNFLNLSDHYAFHKQGIPVLGFFSGLHPDYHKPTDTIDKIEFDEMLKRVRLIYNTTLIMVNSKAFSDN